MHLNLFRSTTTLVVDHYTRHPKFGTLAIHALQKDADGVVLGGIDAQAPIEDIDALVEQPDIVGVDAAVVAWLASEASDASLSVVADEPDPIPEPPAPEEPAPEPAP